jgi:hypothetical protein
MNPAASLGSLMLYSRIEQVAGRNEWIILNGQGRALSGVKLLQTEIALSSLISPQPDSRLQQRQDSQRGDSAMI